jgi:hypothetical protein
MCQMLSFSEISSISDSFLPFYGITTCNVTILPVLFSTNPSVYMEQP